MCRELCYPQPTVLVGEIHLRPRASQRCSRRAEHGQPAFVFGQILCAGLLDAPADVSQFGKATDWRRRIGTVVEKPPVLRYTKTQRAHAGYVVSSEQKVELLQGAHRAPLPPCQRGLASFHQGPTPVVGRRVQKNAERRRVGRRILLAIPQLESGVEQECVLSAQPRRLVSEGCQEVGPNCLGIKGSDFCFNAKLGCVEHHLDDVHSSRSSHGWLPRPRVLGRCPWKSEAEAD